MDDAREILSVLADTQHRIRILRYLDEEPDGVSEISSALDVPRATVKHNLTRLEEEDLIRSVGTDYTITAYGEYVRENVTECLREVALSTELLPFLRFVSRSALDCDLSVFRDSDVTAVSPSNPHAPVERLLELVRSAEYLRVVTPVVLPRLADAVNEAVVERGVHADLILPADTLETVRTRFAGEYEEAIETGRLVVGVHTGGVPFGLYLFEDSIALVGHDETNIARSLVESDARPAVDWASDAFRDYEKRVDTRVWSDGEETY